LPANFPLPILVAQHRGNEQVRGFVDLLQYRTSLRVREAQEGGHPEAGTVYVAPSARHLEIQADGRFSVQRSGRIQHVCPSGNLLLDTAGRFYRERLVAVVLSGTGDDGSLGAIHVRRHGGFVIAQDETTAQFFEMPNAAIETRSV